MSLSCSCYTDGDWWYFGPDDFSILKTSRRKRCCSCKELINIGACCTEFQRGREPLSYVEERIWGDEVQIADWYMCGKCSEIYFNLLELNYCLYLGDSMQENLEEYWALTGFVSIKVEVKNE